MSHVGSTTPKRADNGSKARSQSDPGRAQVLGQAKNKPTAGRASKPVDRLMSKPMTGMLVKSAIAFSNKSRTLYQRCVDKWRR